MTQLPREAHPAVASVLEASLAQLEAKGALKCLVPPSEIVAALCRRLDELGVLTWDDHVAAALILEEAGWSSADGTCASHAQAVAGTDEARLVADYLRVTDATERGHPYRALADYLPLAERILAVQRRRGRSV